MQIRTTVKGGLPCLAVLTHYSSGSPAVIRADPNDSYEGEACEIEFDLYTVRGYPAPWLEKLMSDSDRQRIEVELLEAL